MFYAVSTLVSIRNLSMRTPCIEPALPSSTTKPPCITGCVLLSIKTRKYILSSLSSKSQDLKKLEKAISRIDVLCDVLLSTLTQTDRTTAACAVSAVKDLLKHSRECPILPSKF
jgi:hypothetical protein